MKHIFKLTALFTLIVSIFTFGCGPSKEEQYNTLKQETLKIAEEIDEYDRNLTKEEYKNIEVGKYIKETDKDDKEELAKAIKANKTIAEKLKNKYLAKLEENDKKMKELTNPPDEYKEAYEVLKKCYDDYLTFTNLVINPQGNLTSFTENYNDADSAVAKDIESLRVYL